MNTRTDRRQIGLHDYDTVLKKSCHSYQIEYWSRASPGQDSRNGERSTLGTGTTGHKFGKFSKFVNWVTGQWTPENRNPEFGNRAVDVSAS